MNLIWTHQIGAEERLFKQTGPLGSKWFGWMKSSGHRRMGQYTRCLNYNNKFGLVERFDVACEEPACGAGGGSQVSPSKSLVIGFDPRSGGKSIQTQWMWGSRQILGFGENVQLSKVGQNLPHLTQETVWKIWLGGELDLDQMGGLGTWVRKAKQARSQRR